MHRKYDFPMFKVEYFHKYLTEMLDNMQRLVVYILIISDELIRHKHIYKLWKS
jgi:hypothetical protein